jgi:ATP-binding cassette subfamily F protein 3
VIEVRAGKVASYPGSYDEYVYRVESEIETGLRAPHAPLGPGSLAEAAAAVDRKARARADRDGQKKLKNVERKIAKLDEEKRALSERLLTVTDAAEAQRLHAELSTLTTALTELEEQWLELSSELESA